MESNNKNNLNSLITGKSDRLAAYKKRNDLYIVKNIHPADLADYETQGWEIQRILKTRVVIKKLKPHEKLLEDQTWCLFYRMGYPELNDDQFKIKFSRHDGSNGEKQIDVFAKDDETVIIIECKSRESRGRRTLQKELGETDSLQKPIANSVREYYGQDFKPKIIWIYVTKNIIWSEPDLERAAASNIRVITENEMHYSPA